MAHLVQTTLLYHTAVELTASSGSMTSSSLTLVEHCMAIIAIRPE